MLGTEQIPTLRETPTRRLDELQDLLSDVSRGHHDHIVDPKDLHVDERTGALTVKSIHKDYDFKPLALSQMATKLNIPSSYLQRCPSELRAANVNHWLERQRSDLLVRCDGDQVRAILSHRYAIVNNLDMVAWMREALGPETSLRFEVTEGYMTMHVVQPKDFTARPGDRLNNGVAVRNSEVGLACVEVHGMIYRQICLNGLILAGQDQQWRKRHIGNGDLANRVKEAVNRLRDAAPKAIEGFTALHGIRVPDMPGLFKKVATRYSLTEAQLQAVSDAFVIEPGDTMYHAVNAITRAGNAEALPIEYRHNLQELGGRILENSTHGTAWLN